MIIGFTGASATGKSWVAGQLATLLGFEYQPSRASEIAAETGFDVNAPHTFAERLEYQNNILSRVESDLIGDSDEQHPRNVVFDRTPIDLMAFAIMAANDEIDCPRFRNYLDLCMEVVDYYDLIVLVSPPASELYGEGEMKPGRLTAKVHGYEHRLLYDSVVKMLLTSKKVSHKVLVIPEDLHYEDRVNFVKDRIDEFKVRN